MNLPVLALKAYQKTVAPVLPVLVGGGCGCRFAPTCSQYAIEALETHGLVGGSYLAVRRVLKCQPFHPGGVDLVPAWNERKVAERSKRFVVGPRPGPQRSQRSAAVSFDPVEPGADSSILAKPLNTCG